MEPLQRRADETEERPLTVAQHVNDLAEVAPREPAVVVGWSWGAMLALSYASRHPARVRAVVLVGCGTYSLRGRSEYRRRMEERLGETGRDEMRRWSEARALTDDPAERDRLFGKMGDLASAAQMFDPVPECGEQGDHLAIDEAGHTETWADVLRLQAQGLEPARFASITCPVTMLHGAVDPHPGDVIRDTLLPTIPHLEYVELPKCGHSPWLERSAAEEFMQSLGALLH